MTMNKPKLLFVDRFSDGFPPLVLPHVGMVYAAARRQVYLERSADDVTHAVFESLGAPSPAIHKIAHIAGYLLLRTYREAFNARKSEFRHLLHNGNAVQLRGIGEHEAIDPAWKCIASQLDEALARLSTKYRSVVALHFIEHRSISEVAKIFTLHSDDAQSLCRLAFARLYANMRHGCLPQPAEFANLLRLFGQTDAPPVVFAKIVSPSTIVPAAWAAPVSP